MGKLSMHVKHFKASQINGIDNHNRRTFKNHSNENIDKNKSKDNIPLVEPAGGKSLYRATKELIDKEVKGRITKASVWISEVCFSLPSDVPAERVQEYFATIVDFFQQKGAGRVMAAYVHRDEAHAGVSHDHMHLSICPVTNGKLSRKEIWTKQYLYELHREIPLFLQERGFNVERGSETKTLDDKIKASMPMREYKKFKEVEELAKNEIRELTTKYNELVDEYNDLLEETAELEDSLEFEAVHSFEHSR